MTALDKGMHHACKFMFINSVTLQPWKQNAQFF